MATLDNYDFFNRAVQSGLTEGQFVNAESILIAAGPPTLGALGLSDPTTLVQQNVAFPLGKVQQFTLSHNLAWQRIFEIGSKRSYFISGRAVGTIGLGTVYYHGPSLLRVLYAYYSNTGTVNVPSLYNTGDVMNRVNPHDVKIAPGSGTNGNMWLNLASDIFTQPMGLLLLMRDSNNASVAAFYVEYGVVPTHGISFDSQSVLIQEQTTILFERIVPIDIDGLALITTSSNSIIGEAVGINT
jgi:hypothetical protein